jgi:hypothetical protein
MKEGSELNKTAKTAKIREINTPIFCDSLRFPWLKNVVEITRNLGG